MRFSIYQESRQGGRSNNEDRLAYCYSKDALLMAVCDGMGGHESGEVAAHIVVQTLMDGFQREAKPTVPDPYQFLQKYLKHAHSAVHKYATKHYLADSPRTTVVVCMIQKSVAYWAHAGDSRLYLLRGGKLLAQTRDHSRMRLLLDAGLITPAAIATHPDRNKVYSCLGGSQPPEIEYSRKTPLLAGDVLLLCSDGLWNNLSIEDISENLQGSELAQGIPLCMDIAEKRNGAGGDNLSVIAARWSESYVEPAGSTVFTQQSTGLDDVATRIEAGAAAKDPNGSLSEDDIEKAIEEIRLAIEKTAPKK